MIYCVEDERNIRELLVYTLGTTGFEAKGFGDGKEFKKALKEELPELILLDIMLPGEDGLQFGALCCCHFRNIHTIYNCIIFSFLLTPQRGGGCAFSSLH